MIPIDGCEEVQGLNLIPITVASKFSHFDENRDPVFKERLAHDCSKPASSGQSVNNMVDEDELESCKFGFVLLQCLYELHTLRCMFPSIPILMCKYDLDAAYRRLGVWVAFAVMCAIAFGGFVYICFRLPFGAKAAPSEFSILSEYVAELAQQLMLVEDWDPHTLHPSLLDGINTTPIFEQGPLSQAYPSMLDFTPREISARVYIDDLINITLALPHLIQKAIHAIPLVLDAIFRPNTDEEQHQRNPILNEKKTLAEGILSDCREILGWIINTQNLKVYIPAGKAEMIKRELITLLRMAINRIPVDKQLLASVIGKLTSVSFICPEGKFFLNRLRYRLKVAPRFKGFQFFDRMETEDLDFWIKIITDLSEGHTGRSTNSILHTVPFILTISDACLHGLGGLITVNGIAFAWRFTIPDEWVGILHSNLLEFIAAVWSIKHVCDVASRIKILSIGDNKSTISWLTTNKHNPTTHPNHDFVARYLGKSLFKSDNSLTKGHISGTKNVITDSFSRDTHIPFVELISLLQQHNSTKDQLPNQVVILGENEEELYSLLQSVVQRTQEPFTNEKARGRSTLFRGVDGVSSATILDNQMFSSARTILKETIAKSTTLSPSQNFTDTISSAKQLGFEFKQPKFEILSQKLEQLSRIKVSQTQ